MSKKMMQVVVLLIVGLAVGACTSTSYNLPKKFTPLVNPQIGSIGIKAWQILGSNPENSYQLCFIIEFDKILPAGPEVFWKGDDMIRRGEGITVQKLNDGYTYLIMIDTKKVLETTGSFTPFELFAGTNKSITGYPNFRSVKVERDKDVLESERWRYFEDTPLKVTVDRSVVFRTAKNK